MKRSQAIFSCIMVGFCLLIKAAQGPVQDEINRISSMYVFSEKSDSDESGAHVAKIIPRKKVGTVASVFSCIDQLCIYENMSHQKVQFNDFRTHYTGVIEEIRSQQMVESNLPPDLEEAIHKKIKKIEKKATRVVAAEEEEIGKEFSLKLKRQKIAALINAARDITVLEDHYEIIGEMPKNNDFMDQLFDLDLVRSQTIDKIKEYINNHKKEVKAICIGSGLHGTPSTEVWQPCQCDLQMHRSCYKQCKNNNVSSCINSFCQQANDGNFYPLSWTASFYQESFDRKPKVRSKRIRDEDCPICCLPLKTKSEPEPLGRPSFKRLKTSDEPLVMELSEKR